MKWNDFKNICLILAIYAGIGISCTTIDNTKIPVEKRDTIYITDTIIQYDTAILIQNDSLWNVIAIQEQINDVLSEELFIANYKLERIREYNRIAQYDNNIKFLRGWINRVLND